MKLISGPDGAVQMGSAPVAAAGLVRLPVAGGTVTLDPSAPHRLAVHVHDVDAGSEAVADLLGPEAAEALVATARAGRRDGRATTTLATQPLTATGRDVVRLGLLRWLRTSSPLPVDPVVAVAESAVVASRLDDVLDVDIAASLEDELLDVSGQLLELSRLLRSDGATADDRALLGVLTLDALTVLSNALPLDHAHYAQVLEAVAQHTDDPGMRGEQEAASMPGAHEVLLALAAPRTAVHAGTGQAVRRGESTVDWGRVPSGLVSTEEGSLRWQVEGDRFEVDLPGAARLLDRAPTSELVLHVYAVGRFDPPLARGPVLWDARSASFRGACSLPPSVDPAALLVDVHDPRVRTRPYEGADALARAAQRWSARALALTRWRGSTDGPVPVTYRALDAALTAQRLYADAARQHLLEDRAAQLERAHARTAQLVVLLLRLGDGGDEADEIAEAWAGREDVADVDREPVDVDDLGWVLTTTEQALLRAPRLLRELE
jgi:hypothetical protein